MKQATAAKTTFRNDPPTQIAWAVHPSPAGKLMIGVDPEGAVARISFAPDGKNAAALKQWQKEWPKTAFKKAEHETDDAAKKIAKAEYPDILMAGTPFQQKVWKGLLQIPAGKTVSYGELARKIKSPKAARAVGSACGKNPVAYLVPCHRVVANDGGLGGFSGGLAIKKALLEAEAALGPKTKAAKRPAFRPSLPAARET